MADDHFNVRRVIRRLRMTKKLVFSSFRTGRKEKCAISTRSATGELTFLQRGRPPRTDAFLGGDGAINRFSRRRDADAMDERGGHDYFSMSSSESKLMNGQNNFFLAFLIFQNRASRCAEFTQLLASELK